LWQSFCEQIAGNYENGVCTEVPSFARFGFTAQGRPCAVLTPDFLKSSAGRFTTDQQPFGSLAYQPLTVSMLKGSRQQLTFLLSEVQEKLLFKVSKMSLTMPGLGSFCFDKRMRSYTFNFSKSLKVKLPFTLEQKASSKAASRAPSLS